MTPLFHIFLMFLTCGVFAFSFAIGVLFLIQERKIKTHNPRLLKLPPLEAMDGLHYKALTIGFLLLSFGILTSAILSQKISGRFFNGDPREIATLLVWGLYGLFLSVRIRAGWRGRRGILLSILGFLGVLLAIGLQHRGF